MANCILCGHQSRPIFSTRDYRRPSDSTEYTVLWCDACLFGRLAGSFEPAQVGEFYNVPYYTHGATTKQIQKSLLDRVRCHTAWRVDRGQDLTPSEIGPANGRSICDLGCGAGTHLKAFREAGFTAVGVEPDASARKLSSQFAEVFDGTAESLPDQIRDRSFDVVLLSHVLEHCIDIRKVTQNIKSILKPGGKVIIEVPNNAATGFWRFKESWPWSDVPRHLNFFTEASLCRLLGDFHVERKAYVGYFRQFTPEWIASQHAIWKSVRKDTAPDFLAEAYKLLARTAFAADNRKYDSIRIVASYG